MPWFPVKISELDKTSQRVLLYGPDNLDVDHPVRFLIWKPQVIKQFYLKNVSRDSKILCTGNVALILARWPWITNSLWLDILLKCDRNFEIYYDFSSGQPIPYIQYTKEEIQTWGVIYKNLTSLYPTHACKEYLNNWPLLKKYCGYRFDLIWFKYIWILRKIL